MSSSNGLVADLAQFRSVFLIKPSSLGDIVHTLPAAHFIKSAHPHLELRWMCNPEWMPLLEGNPDITEIVPFPRGEFKGLSAAPKLYTWARALNAGTRALPEITLDFQGLMRSALTSMARGTDPVIGMSDAREGAPLLYRKVVRVNKQDHAVDRYLTLVRALGIDTFPAGVEFPLPEGKRPDAAALPTDYLLLHPYSRGTGKSLSAEALQTLCDCFAPRPVVIAGKCSSPHEISGTHVISLVNRTSLLELIWLIRQSRACVSVDSGPMHISSALQPNTLGIHTWSNPRRVGPYSSAAYVWKAGR
ncbi:MAG: glycosyltransferase family 9 protein, partial [Roseimicrobium sp.]